MDPVILIELVSRANASVLLSGRSGSGLARPFLSSGYMETLAIKGGAWACLLLTKGGVPAHAGDGAGDAALAHARRAGLAPGEQALRRGRRRAEGLGRLGSG